MLHLWVNVVLVKGHAGIHAKRFYFGFIWPWNILQSWCRILQVSLCKLHIALHIEKNVFLLAILQYVCRGQMCAISFPLLAIKSCRFFKVSKKCLFFFSHLVLMNTLIFTDCVRYLAQCSRVSSKPWKCFYINHLMCTFPQYCHRVILGSVWSPCCCLENWRAIVNT